MIAFDPGVEKQFPDTQAFNEALRTIARLTRTASRRRSHKRTA